MMKNIEDKSTNMAEAETAGMEEDAGHSRLIVTQPRMTATADSPQGFSSKWSTALKKIASYFPSLGVWGTTGKLRMERDEEYESHEIQVQSKGPETKKPSTVNNISRVRLFCSVGVRATW